MQKSSLMAKSLSNIEVCLQQVLKVIAIIREI